MRRGYGDWRFVALCGVVWFASACNSQKVRPDGTVVSLRSGYTCCNFHYAQDWINDQNYAKLPMISAGSPIKVTGFGRNYASVEIDGKPFRLGLDYGREAETTEQWVTKLVVAEDPRLKLAAYPTAVRRAIQSGQIMVGMTKDQVIMALGFPSTSDTPRLDEPIWHYWWASFSEYHVHWQDNRVSRITGHPDTLEIMVVDDDVALAPPVVPVPSVAIPAAMGTSKLAPTTKRRGVRAREKSSPGK